MRIASLNKVFFKLNVEMFSSNALFEEFVLRSPRASPMTKPFFALRCKERVLECLRWFEVRRGPHIESSNV